MSGTGEGTDLPTTPPPPIEPPPATGPPPVSPPTGPLAGPPTGPPMGPPTGPPTGPPPTGWPAPPGGSPPTTAAGPTAQQLVPPAVTLALGWIVALGFYLSASDVPGEFLTDNVLPSALLLVAIAAPVALLFAWGEVDLSAFGALPFAGYVYSEASDAGVAPGVLAAVGAGLVIGLCLGLVRWATRAPSAVVTFAAGMVLHAVAFKQIGFEGTRLIDEAIARGSGLPFLAAVVFTASAVAAAVLFWRRAGVGGGDGEAGSPVGPAIIVGYGLSGAAVAAYGALVAGMDRAVVPTDGSMVLLLVLCGVAIGGVVRGNLLIAPITAALGALAAQLLFHTALARAWESFDARLLVAIVLLACLLLAHALHRALAPRPAPTG